MNDNRAVKCESRSRSGHATTEKIGWRRTGRVEEAVEGWASEAGRDRPERSVQAGREIKDLGHQYYPARS